MPGLTCHACGKTQDHLYQCDECGKVLCSTCKWWAGKCGDCPNGTKGCAGTLRRQLPIPAAVYPEMERFLSTLRPDERQIVELRLQGYTNREIAEKLGTYDRKIRRVIEHVRRLANGDEPLQ
jgi:hypothetical protein